MNFSFFSKDNDSNKNISKFSMNNSKSSEDIFSNREYRISMVLFIKLLTFFLMKYLKILSLILSLIICNKNWYFFTFNLINIINLI